MFSLRVMLLITLLAISHLCLAHESRPALLNITETEPGIYNALWKVPAKGQMKLRLGVEFSDGCKVVRRGDPEMTGDAWIERIRLDCLPGRLDHERIYITGLQTTITDVFLRIEPANGQTTSTIIRPDQPTYLVPKTPGKLDVITTYGKLGIDHIAGGIDHLLFLVGLMLLILNFRSLLVTISSFTLAHSITLACVSLGLIPQAGSAIESMIALSILFLIYESLRRENGLSSVTIRNPSIAAFIFGLLHGLGFASALAEIGLPHGEISLALLFFNLGIEAGQVIFVAALALLAIFIRRTSANLYSKGATAVTWCIGIVASYWLFERVTTMVTTS